jgi:hypothetical protein
MTRQRAHQRGQSMVEYAVVTGALVAALFVVEVAGGKTAGQLLADAVREFFRALTFFLSLP